MSRPPKRSGSRGSGPGRSGNRGSGGTRRAGRTPGAGSGRPGARGGGAGTGPPTRSSSAGKGLGGRQVEGRQAVRELLIAGRRRVHEVVLADDLDRADAIADIIDLAEDAGVPVRRVARRKLEAEAHTEAPQGVLARADALPSVELAELCRPLDQGPGRPATPPFLVALDGVTDPRNLGAVLRSADGAGATGVILPRHRAAHVTPAAAKAAAGAAEHLRYAVVGGLPAALKELTEAGVWSIGLDEHGTTPLWKVPAATEAVVLVLGSEGKGLARLVRERCDVLVSIPMAGAMPSLNVSVAGALACFEIARARAKD